VARQRKINNRSIRGIVLNEHADEQARFDMFERINTGSKIANKAELRRGALSGIFMDLIVDLAKDETFMALAPMSKRNEDLREREELVTRFFAYGDGLKEYKDRPAEFIFNYVKKVNRLAVEDKDLLNRCQTIFHETMSFVHRNFPWGFRKSANGKATPRARFEAIAIGSRLAIERCPELANTTVDVSHWIDHSDFKEVTGSDGANAILRLRLRTEFVRDKLLGSYNG
jgi:hypothetical protein